MRIQNITPYNYSNNYSNFNNKTTQNNFYVDKSLHPNKDISFNGIIGKDLLIKYFRANPINIFEKFSKDEYAKLSLTQRNRLRYEYRMLSEANPSYFAKVAEMHEFAANSLKTVFDNRFGKDNYVVVPIGRSVSSVGKVLGWKIGEDNVINVPLSDARRFFNEDPMTCQYAKFLENVKKEKGFDTFLKFLDSVHLSKKDIETSGKNYILLDYCSSGDSLKGAERLFKSDLVWGNSKRNIYAVDFINAISRVKDVNSNVINEGLGAYEDSIVNKFSHYLLVSKFKNISMVGKAHYFKDTLGALPENIIKNADKETKLVWFNLLDNTLSKNKDKIPNLEIKPLVEDLFVPRFPNQPVEAWHDVRSQYKSDLRDELDDINKIMLKVENLGATVMNSNDKIQRAYRDIDGVYRYLSGCYSNIDNPQHRYNFYQIRSDVNKMIDDMNGLLENI